MDIEHLLLTGEDNNLTSQSIKSVSAISGLYSGESKRGADASKAVGVSMQNLDSLMEQMASLNVKFFS